MYSNMFLRRHKADVNFVNEHGNTALHYACFWNYPGIAEDLVDAGAKVNMENKYRETPLDKCQVIFVPTLACYLNEVKSISPAG